jgi:coronin-1B/1C/6
MSSRLRSSKVRHVYADLPKDKDTYSNFQLDSTMGDHNFISAGTKHFALSVKGGGGQVLVVTHGQYGKVNQNGAPPILNGHKSAVLDTAFSPFNGDILATAGTDNNICVWQLPEGGLKEDQTEPALRLTKHSKKVIFLKFHPTSNNVLASASADKSIKVWDIETGAVGADFAKHHPDLIQDLLFNENGSLMFTTCKDKMTRFFDPRASDVVATFCAHESVKAAKGAFMSEINSFVTVGATKQAKRELKVWDIRKLDAATELKRLPLDAAAGTMMPFYDAANKLLFVGGKGDGNLRIFEMADDKNVIYECSNFSTGADPCKGLTALPKASCDILKCETMRILKLATDRVSELKFIIPRKSDDFQEDLFPDDYAGIPAQSAADYFGGANVEPILMSLNPDDRKDVKPTAFAAKPKAGGAEPVVAAGGGGGSKAAEAAPASNVTNAAGKSTADLQKELKVAQDKIKALEAEVKALEAKLAALSN